MVNNFIFRFTCLCIVQYALLLWSLCFREWNPDRNFAKTDRERTKRICQNC